MYLFICYDQGSGGEYFARQLSKCPECNPLESVKLNDERFKTYDMFSQEFLNVIPKIKKEIPKNNSKKYNIVLSHRTVELGVNILKDNVKSIRIQNPKANTIYEFYKRYLRLRKVVLHNLTDKHFLGEIKGLERIAVNPKKFLKSIDKNMLTVDLELLALDLPITQQNREWWINNNVLTEHDEPTYSYDLTIKYEDLFYNLDKIVNDIKDTFNITIKKSQLNKYRLDYEAWLYKT